MSTAIQRDPFADLDIPDALQDSLSRHREHLVHFISSLRSAGLTEEQVDLSVSVMVESYKQELLRAIKALVR